MRRTESLAIVAALVVAGRRVYQPGCLVRAVQRRRRHRRRPRRKPRRPPRRRP